MAGADAWDDDRARGTPPWIVRWVVQSRSSFQQDKGARPYRRQRRRDSAIGALPALAAPGAAIYSKRTAGQSGRKYTNGRCHERCDDPRRTGPGALDPVERQEAVHGREAL